MIVVQDLNGPVTDELKRTKASIRKAKREKQLADVLEVKQQLTQHQKRLMDMRRVLRHGLQPYPLMITASSCTRGFHGESFQSRSANAQDEARCDIRARGF